ncbi:MAG: hypothetical protein Q7J98_14380 [Kiritimatiellia bacterium]|nr:hypothetical protein [Kiritimatiellia bacterium]
MIVKQKSLGPKKKELRAFGTGESAPTPEKNTGVMLKIWITVAMLTVLAAPLRSDLSNTFAEERAIEESIASKPKADLEAGREALAKMRKAAELRKPVLDRPYVFVRSQTKYSGRLYQSCYNWHDRPLFASRTLWEESESDHKYVSFRKTFELYQSYGLDGFATFAWPRPGEYKRTMKVIYDTAAQMGLDPKKFHIMFEVCSDKSYLEINQEKLDLIATNQYSFRVGGKSVISSYVIDSLAPEKLAEYINALRERSGDKILFLPQMHFLNFKDENGRPVNIHHIYEAWRKNNGVLPAGLLNKMKDYLREYLRVCDGLYIGHSSSNPDTTLNEKFSDEILFPLFKSVLAEPEFNGKKLFGAVAKVGYTSYHGAQALSRDGTKTLRKFFELALKHRPDLMICPEWDELNEDTGFEPLLAKPMSSQRIIKYYMSLLKGEKPTPNPGDDLSLPNLIISQKRQLMPGWKMDIELLNVPDTDQGKPYTVRLELLNGAGQVVYSSAAMAFNTAKLKDVTLNLPSEDFKDCQALRPRLTINYGVKSRFSWIASLLSYWGKKQVFLDGLPFTVLRATTCWDQTYFCTPLRNVLRPEKADFKFAAESSEMAPGIRGVSVSADLRAREKLAMVEVVQDSIEQFAWDPRNEYLQNDPDRQLLKFSWHYINNPSRISIEFNVKLDDAPSAITFMNKASSLIPTETVPNELAKGSPAFSEKMRFWNLAQYNGDADWWFRNRLISIKKSEMEKAVLTISGKRTSGKIKGKEFSLRLPLKDFYEYGIYSKVFEDGLMFSLETQYRPHSFPLPLGSGNAEFQARVVADNPNGVLAVRAVTEDGKVYWSAPFAVNSKPSRKTVPVYVYSDTAGKGIRLDIAKNRVPCINYDFSPRRGNILGTDAGHEFYGHAGGYSSTAIGFVGGEAACFSIPFYLYDKGIFKSADKPAPEWIETEDGGGWALKFDGERGNFLVLPNTVIPQRAGFKLSFELKPEEVKSSQVIFANQGCSFGGFVLSVKNGKFEINFIRRTPHDRSQPSYSSKHFRTNLPLYPGKWQKITLAYDESKMSLSADEQTESFDLEGIGLYLQNSHFGGRGDVTKDGVIPFYKGLLRSLDVKHYVEK